MDYEEINDFFEALEYASNEAQDNSDIQEHIKSLNN